MKFQVKHMNKWLEQLGVNQKIENGSGWQDTFSDSYRDMKFVSKDSKGNKINHYLHFDNFSHKLNGEATFLGQVRITSNFSVDLDLSASDDFLEPLNKLNKKYRSEWELKEGTSFEYNYKKVYGTSKLVESTIEESFSEIDIGVEEKKFFEYFQKVWAGSESLQALHELIRDEKNRWSSLANAKGRVLDYKLLSASSPSSLENQVKEAIFNRWEPQGGVSISSSDSYDSFVQAMVKRA